jgi:hypothetical protein
VASKKAFRALIPGAALAAACGPSFQAVYECDVHFEHCNALDMSDVSPDTKTQCWREWLRGYTYGQSRDRVEFARARAAGLSPDEAASGPDGGGSPLAPPPVAAAPMPTTAFAPPPTVSEQRASAPVASSGDGGVAMPGARCADACEKKWASCHSSCKDHACAVCDRTYRSCMPPCFREDVEVGKPAHPRS